MKQISVPLTFELEPCRQGTNDQEESRRVFVSISARVERAFFSAVADCEALKGCRCARGLLPGAVKCSWVRAQIHGAVCGSLSIFVFVGQPGFVIHYVVCTTGEVVIYS